MNNAQISRFFDESSAEEEKKELDKKREFLQQRENDLTQLIENLRWIGQTEQWSSLKEKYFEVLAQTLERALREEATKDHPDGNKLNKLTGQLMWMQRFSDLTKLADTMRGELTGIRQVLYGTETDEL